ncbi:eye-specific diacylglycerol kinase-like isoform X2 [Planococcus citri]
MQKFKHTFKRSKTPTGAEMKIQSSLEVPKQIRSASFDEMKLGSHRTLYEQSSVDSGTAGGGLLQVPLAVSASQRSKSFDSSGTGGTTPPDDTRMFLEVPSRQLTPRRKASSEKSPVFCVHCMYLEELNKSGSRQSSGEDGPSSSRSLTYSDTSTSDDFDSENEYADEENSTDASECVSPATSQFRITVTLSPNTTPPMPPSTLDIPKFGDDEEIPQTTSRRRSITSPKLERQEAFIFNESGENLLDSMDSMAAATASAASIPSPTTKSEDVVVSEFFLQVPDLKRDRAVSVDSCFISKSSHSGKPEEVVPVPASQLLEPPSLTVNNAARSRSVDIVLPTHEQARYKALSTSNTISPAPRFQDATAPSTVPTAATSGRGTHPDTIGETVTRSIRSTPDWTDQAVNGEHLWVPTSVSGDFCYAGEQDCMKHGSRYRCSSCKIVAHQNCVPIIMERTRFTCKPSFRDVGIRQYREHTCIHHHWAHRRSQKGKCKQCGKSFQSKLSFSSKEIVAISCSWCKDAYHNKDSCFNMNKLEEECNLGKHSSIIVPPSWIVKLPRKGSFKSSLRKSPKKKQSSKRKNKEKSEKEYQRAFVIKPIPTANVTPVIVFINPKSGGNQGAKLLQKFQWLLNPRQVFDLNNGGPILGLELFRKVPNLRILACGGDGTVGWILSVLDKIQFIPPPPIGVLPLGTGNDLARALGWGGGYTDEPISKILCNVADSEITRLDRWELKVEKNTDSQASEDGKDNLPLNVVNNYFSFGVDAHIALEFHEAREANPQKFNSRLKNKMFYGQMGGKDLLKRKWKNLAEVVTLECDGKDLTNKLKEHKVHAVVFLNIPSYGGGTHPWNRAYNEQATDDGLIEVVGLTTYQLPLLQAGGHGTCLCQCKTARIVTSKTIPMQVDGEACRLNPSIITLSFLNQAQMLTKCKGSKVYIEQAPEQLHLPIYKISMTDYEQHHYDKNRLRETAVYLGDIKATAATDLEQVRSIVNKMLIEEKNAESDAATRLSSDWCFVDSCTAERFFRIDRAQEHLHYLTDIAHETLFVLNMLAQTPDEDGPFPTLGQSPELSPSEETSKESSLDNSMHQEHACVDKVDQAPDVYSVISNTSSTGTTESVPSEPSERTSERVIQAAKMGDLKTMKELHCNAGYSLEGVDELGQTCLHHAAALGHRDMVKFILNCAHPSLINKKDIRKQTALHKAAAVGERKICGMLVAAGASIRSPDADGQTPKMLASKFRDLDLAAYFE